MVRKAENTDTSECWRYVGEDKDRIRALSRAVACADVRTDIFWEPFPYKDPDKDTPEKANTLLLKEQLLPSVERIE